MRHGGLGGFLNLCQSLRTFEELKYTYLSWFSRRLWNRFEWTNKYRQRTVPKPKSRKTRSYIWAIMPPIYGEKRQINPIQSNDGCKMKRKSLLQDQVFPYYIILNSIYYNIFFLSYFSDKGNKHPWISKSKCWTVFLKISASIFFSDKYKIKIR